MHEDAHIQVPRESDLPQSGLEHRVELFLPILHPESNLQFSWGENRTGWY